MYPHLPIGLFDSGIGGLTVFQQVQTLMPQEAIVYFGDTAHVPYGPRPRWEIEQLVRAIVQWLVAQPVKMILMACNTSSALVLDQLRAEVPVPILGLVLPGARWAVRSGRRIAVLATQATIQSGAYQRALFEVDPLVHVRALSCPEFVPLIEAGKIHDPQTKKIVAGYLEPLQEWPLDTLLYGCTHYPLLEPVIREILGPEVPCVDPAVPTVLAAAQELKALGLTAPYGVPQHRFCVSGDPEAFARTLARTPWLQGNYTVDQVRLMPLLLPTEE